MFLEKCPWGAGATNYSFPMCEESLCGWVSQPANAWSNLAMLIVGIYIILFGINQKSKLSIYHGGCIVFMGLCSFFAHSSGLPLFGKLDVVSIFNYLGFLVSISFLKNLQLKKILFYMLWLSSFTFSLSLMYLLPDLKIIALIIYGACLMFLEAGLVGIRRSVTEYKYLFSAAIVFLLGILFLYVDQSMIMCAPENHFFQFHALWHIFAALGMLFIFKYLQQFKLN